MNDTESAEPENAENVPSPSIPTPKLALLLLRIVNNPSAGCSRLKLVLDAPRNLNPPVPRTPTSSGTLATPVILPI